ncbi:MAG: GNAT family N-acetyltransferase [Clostridiales bacterium]|nr:GNAT family N-acetyltransferase [Clostridiales bacterium]
MLLHHRGTLPLETKRLILRRFQPGDAPAVFANWTSDPMVSRFWSWQPHQSLSDTQTVLTQWILAYQQPDYYHWVLVHQESGQPIGAIYLADIDPDDQSASVHYLLGKAYWNQGLTTEACRRVLSFAFDDVGFQTIRSHHHRDNPASGRVLQKCRMAFVQSAYLETSTERLNGEYLFYQLRNNAYQPFLKADRQTQKTDSP